MSARPASRLNSPGALALLYTMESLLGETLSSGYRWVSCSRTTCTGVEVSIPKIIYQISIEKSSRNALLGTRAQQLNAGWKYRLWPEDDLLAELLTGEKIGLLHGSRRRYPCWKNKYRLDGIANILKYEVLHRFGGIFVNHRAKFLNPLPDELTNNDSFAGPENPAMWPDLLPIPIEHYLTVSYGPDWCILCDFCFFEGCTTGATRAWTRTRTSRCT